MTAAFDLPSDPTARRRLGAYYTPPSAARMMTDWVTRDSRTAILEPSFGDGAFLRALRSTDDPQARDLQITGAEIDPLTFRQALDHNLLTPSEARCGDFLAMPTIPVAGAVGNPPYVRLRHLPRDQRDQALAVARNALGHDMDPSGSVWMPFVLHACGFLRPDGRFAFVLPYDLSYVKYARPLWAYLGRTFGDLRVVRVHERLFPDIGQDTVVLFADGKGRSTGTVTFDAYEKVDDLLAHRVSASTPIDLADIVGGERPFLRALVSPELRTLLDGRLQQLTQPAHELATFNIGYVTGDKSFFHPDVATAQRYEIPVGSLRPAITSTRQVTGQGLWTSALQGAATSRLFAPPVGDLTSGEAAYVASGERRGVDQRYKCRVRHPWYAVPYVRVPDVVVSVFAERPLLMVNDAEVVASNSLLCGYLRPGCLVEDFAAAWYTSLTLLQTELEVHSLGGGVFVLVPNEAGRIRLPRIEQLGQSATASLRTVHRLLAEGDTAAAYGVGDAGLLASGVGLTSDEVEVVKEGTARLAHWRRSARGEVADHPVDV